MSMRETAPAPIDADGQDRLLAAVAGVAHLLRGPIVSDDFADYLSVRYDGEFLGSYVEGDDSIAITMDESINGETGVRRRELAVYVSQVAISRGAEGEEVRTIQTQSYQLDTTEDSKGVVEVTPSFFDEQSAFVDGRLVASERDRLEVQRLWLVHTPLSNGDGEIDTDALAKCEARLTELNDQEVQLREIIGEDTEDTLFHQDRLNTVVTKLESLARRYAV